MQHRTRIRVVLCVGALLALTPGAIHAHTPEAVLGIGKTFRPRIADTLHLTLDAARTLARRENRELRAARYDIAIASGVRRQAGLWAFSPTAELLRGAEGNGVDLSFTQEIELPGKPSARKSVAGQGEVRAIAETRDVERRIIAEVDRAFYRVTAALQRVRVAEEVLSVDQRLAEAVAKQLDAGEVNRIEYNLATIEFGRSRSRLVGAQRDLKVAQLRLAELLGVSTGTIVLADAERFAALPDSAAISVAPTGTADTFNVAQLASRAMHSRPDVAAREATLLQAQYSSTSARREALPNLLLRATIEQTSPTERAFRPGIGLSIPLLNRNQGFIASADAAASQAEESLRGLSLRVTAEVSAAVADYLAASTEVAMLRSAVLQAGRQNRDLSEIAYREGKIGLPEVLLIRTQATSAELDYWAAWLTEREAFATLQEVLATNLYPTARGSN